MEEQNKIKKGMPVWLSIVLSLVIAGLATGGTWYVMDQKAKKNDDKVTTLQGQVDKLTKDAAKVTPTPTATVTPTPSTSTTGNTVLSSPVISYKTAGTFTDQEKNEIKNKITDPYLYFEKISGSEVMALLLEEIPEGNKGPNEYSYSIDVILKTGYGGGWVFGLNNKVDYWKAICGTSGTPSDEFGVCPAGMEDFKAKYPNNYNK